MSLDAVLDRLKHEERIAAQPPEEQALPRELLDRVAELVVDKPLDEVVLLVDRMTEGNVGGDIDEEERHLWTLTE